MNLLFSSSVIARLANLATYSTSAWPIFISVLFKAIKITGNGRRKALAQFCVLDGFQGKRDGFSKGGNALGLSWGRFRIELGIHSKFQGKHYPSPRSLMQAFENLRLQMM